MDYAHARYYSSTEGRFTTADPLMSSARPSAPQTWNRYSYGLNNPLKYTDSSGEDGNFDAKVARTEEVDAAIPRVVALRPDVLIVTGPVTRQARERLLRTYEQMPEPKFVISVGSCSISGGVFEGCYNVGGSVDEVIPVDVFIPGCPPRPEALIHAFMMLQRKIDAQKLGGDGRPRHIDPDAPSEFPVPQFGEHDLVPPKNPEVWRPPAAAR